MLVGHEIENLGCEGGKSFNSDKNEQGVCLLSLGGGEVDSSSSLSPSFCSYKLRTLNKVSCILANFKLQCKPDHMS